MIASRSRPLVLIVDDDVEIAVALTGLLAAEGFDVARAAHGVDALEVIGRIAPDVILLDLIMPLMSGRELLAREETRSIPIVIMTAGAIPGDRLGGVRVLRKPFAFDALVTALREKLYM